MLLGTSARTDRRRPAVKGAVALLLALAAHLAVLGILLLLPRPAPVAPKARPQAVALRTLRADEWSRNRGDTSSARSAAEPAKKKVEPKVEKDPDGQVVAVERGNGETAPDAKFLAERSNRVEKETRAREQTNQYVNPSAQRTSPRPNALRGNDDVPIAVRGGNGGKGDDDASRAEGKGNGAVVELPRQSRVAELNLRPPDPKDPGAGGVKVAERPGRSNQRGNSDRLLIFPGAPDGENARKGSEGRAGAPGLRTLVPSESKLGQILGAPANDHLEDVEEGDGTFLNTREWKYASFFNRVKQSVGAHWDPSQKLQVRDPTGSIYGGRDRQTLVHVTLDEAGQLKDIYVEKSSGLDFLDNEAVKAFERAAPFPHPPPGLLAADSTVRFTFGFFLDMGGGGLRIRGFRQGN